MSIVDKFRLDGKTALVTGSSSGIGRAIAITLANAGASVVCHSSSVGGTYETVAAISNAGGTGASVAADLSIENAGTALFDDAVSKFGRIDILINNAGTIRRSPAVEYSDEDWSTVINVNLSSLFRLSRAAGRHMIGLGSGKIVNIASLLSFQGGITVPAYTASKSAVAGLTKALANEWARHNVNVNAIAPGYIATANTAALRADVDRNRQIMERIPAGRWGDPDDLAGAAVFLSSAAADYVHGHIMVVDGGWMGR